MQFCTTVRSLVYKIIVYRNKVTQYVVWRDERGHLIAMLAIRYLTAAYSRPKLMVVIYSNEQPDRLSSVPNTSGDLRLRCRRIWRVPARVRLGRHAELFWCQASTFDYNPHADLGRIFEVIDFPRKLKGKSRSKSLLQ